MPRDHGKLKDGTVVISKTASTVPAVTIQVGVKAETKYLRAPEV